MASADRSTLFINATILDGSEHMEPQPDMAVAVERGVITWMGPSAVAQAPAGAEVIDLAGACLMPGLINMHVHLCGSGKPVSAGDAGALMKKLDNPVGRAIVRQFLRAAQQQLASGDHGARRGRPLFADLAVRDAIDAGKYQGPRWRRGASRCRAALGPVRPGSPPGSRTGATCARGADVIKLFVTGGVFDATEVGERGVLRMPVGLPRRHARRRTIWPSVMAHVSTSVKAALEAGVDMMNGAPLTPEILSTLWAPRHAARGRAPSVTCPALPFVLLDPEKDPFTDTQRRTAHCARHHRAPVPHWKLALRWALVRTRAACS
ncbi:MAG: amidohydrolase family protein [Collinsella aerofaciens]